MDEATRTRCLEPFFTTKGERGTGLCLAMVYGMLQRHGGDVQIESEPGPRHIDPIGLPLCGGGDGERRCQRSLPHFAALPTLAHSLRGR